MQDAGDVIGRALPQLGFGGLRTLGTVRGDDGTRMVQMGRLGRQYIERSAGQVTAVQGR